MGSKVDAICWLLIKNPIEFALEAPRSLNFIAPLDQGFLYFESSTVSSEQCSTSRL
jgi:hypothetical protein